MSFITVRAAHCDVCGHEWIPLVDVPSHCARCKSRRWNFMGALSEKIEDNLNPGMSHVEHKAIKSEMRDLFASASSVQPVESTQGVFVDQPMMAELCSKTGYNETDGETYRCSLLKGHKTNCRPGERV